MKTVNENKPNTQKIRTFSEKVNSIFILHLVVVFVLFLLYIFLIVFCLFEGVLLIECLRVFLQLDSILYYFGGVPCLTLGWKQNGMFKTPNKGIKIDVSAGKDHV